MREITVHSHQRDTIQLYRCMRERSLSTYPSPPAPRSDLRVKPCLGTRSPPPRRLPSHSGRAAQSHSARTAKEARPPPPPPLPPPRAGGSAWRTWSCCGSGGRGGRRPRCPLWDHATAHGRRSPEPPYTREALVWDMQGTGEIWGDCMHACAHLLLEWVAGKDESILFQFSSGLVGSNLHDYYNTNIQYNSIFG